MVVDGMSAVHAWSKIMSSDTPQLFLHEVEIEGFRNITQKVTLSDLGKINVIHGPNNVGKSNLLKAIKVGFENLGSKPTHIDPSYLNAFKEQKIFTSFTFSGMKDLHNNKVQVALNSAKQSHGYILKKNILSIDLGRYYIESASRYLNNDSISFSFIDVHRRIYPSKQQTRIDGHLNPNNSQKPNINLEIIPQSLKYAFLKASKSFHAEEVRRWELFVDAMHQFDNVIGEGEFDTALDFETPNISEPDRADLVFDQEQARISVSNLGSGIQQIVALLGSLLLTDAKIVLIEEPELNLRYSLQQQLLSAFKLITESEYGPSQLIMTSHSPAFESGTGHFYAMTLDEDGVPQVEKKPNSQAVSYVGDQNIEIGRKLQYREHPEPDWYVSSEGLLKIPESMLKELGIDQGGGLFFQKNPDTGKYEVWTTNDMGAEFETLEAVNE